MGSEKQTLEHKCANPACGQVFVMEIARAELLNSLSVSMVVWAHSDIQACPFCGQGYVMQVLKVEKPTIQFTPVKSRADASVVIPPAGMRLPPPPDGRQH